MPSVMALVGALAAVTPVLAGAAHVQLRNGDAFRGNVLAFRDGQLILQIEFGDLRIPAERLSFVAWQPDANPAAARAHLLLADGSRLSGSLQAIEQGRLIYVTPYGTAVVTDLGAVAAVGFEEMPAAELPARTEGYDVLLADGGLVRGVPVAYDGNVLVVRANYGDLPFPKTAVAGLRARASIQALPPEGVVFSNGDRVRATLQSISSEAWTFELRGGHLVVSRPQAIASVRLGPLQPPKTAVRLQVREDVYGPPELTGAEIPVGGTPTGLALSRDGTRAFVVDGTGGVLRVLDLPSGSQIGQVSVGAGATAVALSADGQTAYVVNPSGGMVTLVETATFRKVADISVGSRPVEVVTSPGGWVYVRLEGSDSLVALRPSAGQGVAWRMGSRVTALAPSGDGRRLFVARADSKVAVLDAASGTVVKEFTTPYVLTALAVGAGGQQLVGLAAGRNIYDFEDGMAPDGPPPERGALPWAIASGSARSGTMAMRSARIRDRQTSVWKVRASSPERFMVRFWVRVSSERGYDVLQFLIDGARQGEWSGEVPWTPVEVAVPAGEHILEWRYSKDASVSEGDDAAWVDDLEISSGSKLTFVDAGTGSVAFQLPLPSSQAGMAVTPDGRFAYLALPEPGRVLAVDLQSGTVVAELRTGGRPQNVVVSSDGRLAYVVDAQGAKMLVVRTGRGRIVGDTVVRWDKPPVEGVITFLSDEVIHVVNEQGEHQIPLSEVQSIQFQRRGDV